MKDKAEILSELRSMLGDVFTAKERGEAYGRLARAHGYVDGYMRALLEVGVTTKEELLEIVHLERERASGPAMHALGALVDASATRVKTAEVASSETSAPADAAAVAAA